ncbi:uncharacterized protein LOC107362275 [Tetranychus urticae]|uniref:Uncharacterized protein n=1 Tax=Tetranychus urticae TaxID=32264 RepID=T1KBS4_TETUR|nr:uncharacterized protein LOC107362275 [Tetranychus urticae]
MNLFNTEGNNYQKYQNSSVLIVLTIGFLILGINGQDVTGKPILVTSKPLIVKGPVVETCKTLRFEAHIFPLPCKKYNTKCGTKNPMNCDSFKAKHEKNCEKIKLNRPTLYTKLCTTDELKQ